jgi:tetratricopeptide (TPR) repeat protein
VRLRAFRLAALGVVVPLLGAAPAETVTNSNFGQALSLLHDGRFDAAEEQLRAAGRGADLESAFLQAFVCYWRLLYDDKNTSLQGTFDTRLTRTISLAEARLETNPKDQEAAVLGGTAHVLRAQLLGRQKKAMAVANEAKRGRRILVTTPDPDALFGLGSYNYSIDQLKGAARSLRAVMGIPAGNRAEGLRQLERAAREGRRFGLEARLLLMVLYAGKREHQLDEAWRQAQRLVQEHGGSVVALDAAAQTALLSGRADQAAAWLERGIKEGVGADAAVTSTLRLQRARCELARFRPEKALEWLAPLLANPALLPASQRDELQEAVAAARALPAAPGDGEAAVKLAQERPEDAVAALHAGRALVLAGRAQEALPLLTRAERSGRIPDPWLGPSRLLAGQAADLLGQRTVALDWYKKALESPEWVGKEAPRRWMARPYRGDASS